MTPNGAVVFALLISAGSLLARDLPGLAAVLAVALLFGLALGRRVVSALIWSAAIVLPLAAFMTLVWVGIVGRATSASTRSTV